MIFVPMIFGAMFSIIHSSDGGVDDFATTALIAAAQEKDPSFDFPAVIITNGDCEPVSALAAGMKTAKFLNMDTQVALSSSRVWNQFPWIWRMDSNAVNQIPCLQGHTVDPDFLSLPEGNDLLIEQLRKADDVKLIATGPLTTIADVLKAHPELIEKISELHWMGGALDIAGNILHSPEIPKELLNEKAEWNVFCDPVAADWVFKNTSFAIYLYPLDISDRTIPNHFIKILNQKKSTVHSNYISECYKIVENVVEYRMWDVVAAAGVLFPEVLELPVKEILRIEIGFKEQGALLRDDQGREVFVYKEFKNNDPAIFYETVANLLTKE